MRKEVLPACCIALALVPVCAASAPLQFDLVCTGAAIRAKDGTVALAAPKHLYTLDLTKALWCETECSPTQRHTFVRRGDVVVLSSSPQGLSTQLDLKTLRVSNRALGSAWVDTCVRRRFSDFKTRATPY